MTFGSGTGLLVEPKQKGDPSFYQLGSDVCLATGFSKYTELNETEPFSKYKTEPTRIPDDPFFDKAIILKGDDKCPTKTTDDDAKPCHLDFQGVIETDSNINLLSLTVLGLRFLFLKSILFNVLMTIRAWSS